MTDTMDINVSDDTLHVHVVANQEQAVRLLLMATELALVVQGHHETRPVGGGSYRRLHFVPWPAADQFRATLRMSGTGWSWTIHTGVPIEGHAGSLEEARDIVTKHGAAHYRQMAERHRGK